MARDELGTPPEEFPSPHAEPTGPAPGTDPIARKIIERQREGEATRDDEGSLKDALSQVSPEEAATRVQQDPKSPRPAPEG